MSRTNRIACPARGAPPRANLPASAEPTVRASLQILGHVSGGQKPSPRDVEA